MEVEVEAADVDSAGLAVDFGVLKKELDAVLEMLDHRDLNTLDEFSHRNPSAENIARTIFDRLRTPADGLGVRLVAVSVWESDDSCATYHV